MVNMKLTWLVKSLVWEIDQDGQEDGSPDLCALVSGLVTAPAGHMGVRAALWERAACAQVLEPLPTFIF